MITPVVQRQMFQTINAEAVRAAMEVSGVLQRENGQRQAMLDRVAEDQVSVPEIPEAQGLKTEERQGGHADGGGARDGQHPEGRAETPDDASATAIPAEGHLDFLA